MGTGSGQDHGKGWPPFWANKPPTRRRVLSITLQNARVVFAIAEMIGNGIGPFDITLGWPGKAIGAAVGSFADDLPSRISSRLSGQLPGRAVHRELAPELSYGRHFSPPLRGARMAAVVALSYQYQGRWHLLLTVRSPHVADHAGQVCLPGGAVESGESHLDAALRELHEELGIRCDRVQVAGRLSSVYVFGSNFLVFPWVAFLDFRPTVWPNPSEVSRVLEVPLGALLDTRSWGRGQFAKGGLSFAAPYVLWEGHRIWGGTALILGELTALLREIAGE